MEKSVEFSMKPIVLWVSGAPNYGKTYLSKQIKREIQPFSTDIFVKRIIEWCDDKFLLDTWEHCGTHRIGKFLDLAAKHGKESYIAKKLIEEFDFNSPVSIIEGYMPVTIQERIMAILENQGYAVWLAISFDQYNKIKTVSNWR